MDPVAVLYVEFYMSAFSFALVAWRYVVPTVRGLPFSTAITPFLILHSFRHIGMMYIVPSVVPAAPAAFANPTAYGDLATAALALVALGALRLSPGAGRAMVWVFNVVGFVDLGVAAVNAQRFELLRHQIGVAYLLPAIFVPALIVSHVLVFWLLLRRSPPAPAKSS